MITLEHGIDEALHYMRRPIAVCTEATPDEVSTMRPLAIEGQAGEMPAAFDIWLTYSDLVVMTACNGSQIMKYIGSPSTWLRFAALNASVMLGRRGPRMALGRVAAEAPAGGLVIDGVEHESMTDADGQGLVTRMAVLHEVVVAVAGRLDAVDAARLTLVRPDRKHAATVYLGPYPRYRRDAGLPISEGVTL